MKNTGKKLLSLLLCLLLSLSLFPFSALAGLEGPYQSGEKNLIFNYVTLSGAGAAQMSDWASGEYPGAREELGVDMDRMDPAFLKTRLMVKAMHVNAREYEVPISFYIPAGDGVSTHELTLYGYEDIDPADISIVGVRCGDIQRHVYGDTDSEGFDGRLYWYTIPVSVPANDAFMEIWVSGELYATLPLIHISGESPYALYTTMQVYDYEEGDEEGTLRSMTLRVSGFNLTDDPLQYTYRWISDPEAENAEDQYSSVDAASVTGEDEFGYRYVTFDFNGDTPTDGMIWGRLLFDNAYPAYFFGAADHLVNDGTEEAPVYRRFRTDYSPEDEYAPYGTNCEVPSPYYCIFKEPASPGEAPEVMPGLSGGYYNEALGMNRTYNHTFWVTIHPGSYEGGEVLFSDDIGATGYQRMYASEGGKQAVYMARNPSDPDFGVKHIWATFFKEGLRTVKVPLLVDYVNPKAPTPTNPGCVDAESGMELDRVEGGISVTGPADRGFRFYTYGPKGVTMYLSFFFTDPASGNTYQTGNTVEMVWNADSGRYELDLLRGEVPPDAEEVQMQILNDYNGGFRDNGDPVIAPLWNPEPGFRPDPAETRYETIMAYLYAKDYAGGTVAVSFDGGASWSGEMTPSEEYFPSVTLTLPQYGDNELLLRFTKEGLTPFVAGPVRVYYDDGRAPAPEAGSVLAPDGTEAEQRGGAWILTGEEDAAYTFRAFAHQDQSLEALFARAEGEVLLTRDMSWNEDSGCYELTLARSLLREAAQVRFRVKAEVDGRPGRELTLLLKTVEPGFVRTLYAPAVPSEVKRDGEGNPFRAVAPGAVISGLFAAADGEGRTRQMTLRYLDREGTEKTVAAPAAEDGNGQLSASLALPEDADRLVSLRYELLNGDALEAGAEFDMSDYRVLAETLVTGIPAEYEGVLFSFRGEGTEKSLVLTAEDCAALSLGDLPGGSYTYEFSGKSGHIFGGSVSLARGDALALSGLPGLGSLTVSTGDTEVDARVSLALTTPDGEEHRASGVPGVKLEQLPLGSEVTVTLDYDASAYPDILGYSPAGRTLTIAGEETADFVFSPISYRTVKGRLVRSDTGRGVSYVTVSLEQTVTLGGAAETVCFTGRTDYSGNFSIRIYDGVEARLAVRHVTYLLEAPVTVTEPGDTDLGDVLVGFSTELVVPVKLVLLTPNHVDMNGNPYRDAEGNVLSGGTESLANSSVIPMSYINVQGGGTLRADQDYDIITMGGDNVLRFHEGAVAPGSTLRLWLSRTVFNYNDEPYVCGPNYYNIDLDENGNAVLEIQAVKLGGEVRAAVVEENDQGYVGFLKVGRNFSYGVGELSVPYESGQKGTPVYAWKIRPEDVDSMINRLQTLPEGSALAESVSQYVRNFPDNAVMHIDSLKPDQPAGSGIFGSYIMNYQLALSNRKGYALVTGVIEPRYRDEENRVITKILCNGANGAPLDYIFDGKPYSTYHDWENTKDENGFYLPTKKLTFSCEVPLDAANNVNLGFRLYIDTLKSVDADGKATYRNQGIQQVLGVNETLNIFDLSAPDFLIIKEEQKSQGKADWTARLSLRTFISDVPEENLVTIWDNGVAIDRFTLSSNRYNSTVFARDVHLTDNHMAGLHTLWATRQLDGETITTYSQCLPVLLGGEEDKFVYVSQIQWTHYNHRTSWDPNEPDYLFFSTLGNLEGEEIWIWPDKRHDMHFFVNNATSRELESVTFVYTTMVKHEGWRWFDNMGHHSDEWLEYWTERTGRIECTHHGDWEDKGSWWGFTDKYLGYITGFRIEFTYKADINPDQVGPTDDERAIAELEALYEANDLGEVPNDMETVDKLNGASNAELQEALGEDSDLLPEIFRELTLTPEETGNGIRFTAAPTEDVPQFSISMSEGGEMKDNDIWLLMEKEREEGSQNPDEKPEDGWKVYWAQMNDIQGYTMIRLAVLNEQLPDGRYHYVTHRSTYLPTQVAAALEGSGALMDSFTDRADRGKKVYDTFSEFMTYTDLGNTMYVNRMEKEMRLFMGSAEAGEKFGKECSFVSDRAGKAMAILGVADTAYSFYKGPDGKDGTGLRQLLEHVQDERFRRSIERQIKDYEDMRQDIFNQDMTMKTLSSASNFYTPGGIWMKLSVFLGGLGNTYLSDRAKEFNQQVYDTTLLDIQRQIRFERVKASYGEAEQWLRNKMDSIYGKGNWSEYTLAEERKYWVLVRDETGAVHYVWHEKAGNYKPYWDPSGYVFEALEDERLDGVTATLYFTDTLNEAGEPVDFSVWSDGPDGQRNPLETLEGGQYGWMVPNGWWKVRYEKEGYRSAESRPMNVPPIHTTVNIGLLSTEAPRAAVTPGTGEITVLFTKYMQLESLVRLFGGESYEAGSFDGSAFAVQFFDADGRAVAGTVSFPDKKANTGYTGRGYGTDVIDSGWFARTAVFTPADPEADLSGVTWRFAPGMVSYAGVPLDEAGASLYLVRLDPGPGVLGAASAATDETGHVTRLPAPIREGYAFDGWYTEPEAGTLMTAEDAFEGDTTLYAHWRFTGEDRTEGYLLNGISILDAGGQSLTAVPSGSFTARVSVTNLSSEFTDTLWVAAYDAEGRMLRCVSLPLVSEIGETVSLDADFRSASGAAKVKAFVLSATGAPLPLAGAWEFP